MRVEGPPVDWGGAVWKWVGRWRRAAGSLRFAEGAEDPSNGTIAMGKLEFQAAQMHLLWDRFRGQLWEVSPNGGRRLACRVPWTRTILSRCRAPRTSDPIRMPCINLLIFWFRLRFDMPTFRPCSGDLSSFSETLLDTPGVSWTVRGASVRLHARRALEDS